MKLLIGLCLLISSNIFAFEEIWKLNDQFIPLIKEEKQHLLISKSCSNKDCEAFKILKTISMKKIDSAKFSGGRNPGAVICDSLKNAKIIYLKDMQGNENSFCFFKDKSFVSSSTLMIYANQNDGVK